MIATCGDGRVKGDELCDGDELQGESCAVRGDATPAAEPPRHTVPWCMGGPGPHRTCRSRMCRFPARPPAAQGLHVHPGMRPRAWTKPRYEPINLSTEIGMYYDADVTDDDPTEPDWHAIDGFERLAVDTGRAAASSGPEA